VSLLFKYPERTALLPALARLAREELVHFERVLACLAARGITFRHQVPSPYAARLREMVRPGEPDALLDLLLCAALIEARSCERLRLLAEAVDDLALAELYAGLLASEARHHRLYVTLATRVAPRAEVHARLAELSRHEATVLAAAPAMARLHA
jgi:tRNA-(ms[2]io[6]A)-hydroxylase